jgi:hypothetical protein
VRWQDTDLTTDSQVRKLGFGVQAGGGLGEASGSVKTVLRSQSILEIKSRAKTPLPADIFR